MRCKIGDLAMVVNDYDFPENNGKLVMIKGIPTEEDYGDDIRDWDCEPLQPILAFCGDEVMLDTGDVEFWDAELFPIRDQEGQDQTITWAGLPGLVTA